ncbi:TPA: DUF1983 domain-containing protein, partial [Proteus mirabilis]|nr:DUF1983 domain-containing protein [Proteus mirabilis]
FWFSEKQITDIREVESRAEYLGIGTMWVIQGRNLKAGHIYYIYVRSINAVGKSVFVEAKGEPNSNTKEILDELDGQFMTTDAGKQLSERLDWNAETAIILSNEDSRLSRRLLVSHGQSQAGIRELWQVRATDNEAWAQEVKEIYSAVGDNKSAIKETQTSITELNKAMAKSEEQVQAQFGEQQGMINQKMQAEFSQTGDGVVTHSINITIVHNNVKYNAAGQVISAQVKNGKLESFFGYNANNFAWYNPSNGKMELFMYAKNGQLFMREVFINEAWLNSVVVTEYIKSGDYVPGNDGFLIDGKTSNIEMNKGTFRGELDIGTNKTGAHTVITNERIAVYGDKGEIRIEIGKITGV